MNILFEIKNKIIWVSFFLFLSQSSLGAVLENEDLYTLVANEVVLQPTNNQTEEATQLHDKKSKAQQESINAAAAKEVYLGEPVNKGWPDSKKSSEKG